MNDTAPWSGVLVSNEQYMFYQSSVEKEAYLESHPKPCDETPGWRDVAAWIGGGFLLGLVASSHK